MSHTEEKLTLFSRNGTTAILDENGHEMVGWMGFDRSEWSKREHKANARRLVACWNACIDIPTDKLERHQVSLCGFTYKELEKERDELLAALRRQFKADDVLYAMPSDCDKEEHEAAMKEHYKSYTSIAAILAKYKETK